MKGVDLYEAIGGISDQYIEEAHQVRNVFPFRTKTTVSVASFVAVLILGVTSYEYTHRSSTGDAQSPETVTITREFLLGTNTDSASAVAEENIAEGIAEVDIIETATVEDVRTEEAMAKTESLDIVQNDIKGQGLKVEYKGTVYYEKHCCELIDSKNLSSYGEFVLVEDIGEDELCIIEGTIEIDDLYIEEATETLAILTGNLLYLFIKES